MSLSRGIIIDILFLSLFLSLSLLILSLSLLLVSPSLSALSTHQKPPRARQRTVLVVSASVASLPLSLSLSLSSPPAFLPISLSPSLPPYLSISPPYLLTQNLLLVFHKVFRQRLSLRSLQRVEQLLDFGRHLALGASCNGGMSIWMDYFVWKCKSSLSINTKKAAQLFNIKSFNQCSFANCHFIYVTLFIIVCNMTDKAGCVLRHLKSKHVNNRVWEWTYRVVVFFL